MTISSGNPEHPSQQTASRRQWEEAPPQRPILLSIAGFDPSAGAGIAQDLKVFAAYRCYGMACITALTVQSTQGVARVESVAQAIVGDTLDCLALDAPFSAVKIGMLAEAETVSTVAAFLVREQHPRRIERDRVVLDPVIRSTSGRALLSQPGIRRILDALLPVVGWVTPNLAELAELSGMGVSEPADVPAAARRLQALSGGGLQILVTGGHFARPDDFLLTSHGEEIWIPGERVSTTSTHGTGCTLSSALACELAQGNAPLEAVRGAKAFVTESLRAAFPVGKGIGPVHPLFRCD